VCVCSCVCLFVYRQTHTHTHTHILYTHTHVGFYGLRGLSSGVMVFILYRLCYCPTPTLHLNLALTGDCAFLLSPKKTHSVWFMSVLNYGDTENVLIILTSSEVLSSENTCK